MGAAPCLDDKRCYLGGVCGVGVGWSKDSEEAREENVVEEGDDCEEEAGKCAVTDCFLEYWWVCTGIGSLVIRCWA